MLHLSWQEVSSLSLVLARPSEACSDQRLQHFRNAVSALGRIPAVEHDSDGIRRGRGWSLGEEIAHQPDLLQTVCRPLWTLGNVGQFDVERADVFVLRLRRFHSKLRYL